MIAVPLHHLMGEQNAFIHPYGDTKSQISHRSSQLHLLKMVLRVNVPEFCSEFMELKGENA